MSETAVSQAASEKRRSNLQGKNTPVLLEMEVKVGQSYEDGLQVCLKALETLSGPMNPGDYLFSTPEG